MLGELSTQKESFVEKKKGENQLKMTDLLTVPLKRGSDVDVAGPLIRWIKVLTTRKLVGAQPKPKTRI